MKTKIYTFIDSQNLNLGVQAAGWKLDFSKFRRYLWDKYKVEKAYLFVGKVSGNEKLYKYLKMSGYMLIFKPTLQRNLKGQTEIKGNVDAELVLHTMIEFPNFTKAIIVSGDGDFHCLVEHLAIKKKLLRVLVPNKRYSALLRRYNRYIVRVDLLRKTLEQKIKKTEISVRSKP